MFRIKRTKQAPPGPLQTAMVPAVHYAASIAPAGNVTAWTADSARAGAFDADVVTKVKSHYAAVANAGKLDYEALPEPPKLPPVPTPAAPVAPVVSQPAPAAPPAPAPKLEPMPFKGRK